MSKTVAKRNRPVVSVDLRTHALKAKLEKIACAERRTLSSILQIAAVEVAERGYALNGTTPTQKTENV